MKKVTIIMNDGTVHTQDNVTYVLFDGVKLVIVLSSNEQFSILAKNVATLDIE